MDYKGKEASMVLPLYLSKQQSIPAVYKVPRVSPEMTSEHNASSKL